MSFAHRLKIFAVGFTVGLVILFVVLNKRQGERKELTAPPTAEAVQREAVPGVLEAYRERRVAMDSKFIAEQHRKPLPGKAWMRILILRGMDPEQVLRIEEYTHEESGVDLVDRVVVMAPDRVEVTLTADATPSELAQASQPLGCHLLAKTPDGAGVIVGLGGSSLDDYAQAVEGLQALDQLVAGVQPVIYGEAEPFKEDQLKD
ncbi:MAG: hypothetical protein ACQKBW_11815 [Puniceicoccales bacterium]